MLGWFGQVSVTVREQRDLPFNKGPVEQQRESMQGLGLERVAAQMVA